MNLYRDLANSLSEVHVTEVKDADNKIVDRALQFVASNVGKDLLSVLRSEITDLDPAAANFIRNNSKDVLEEALSVAAQIIATGSVTRKDFSHKRATLKELLTNPKAFLSNDVLRPTDFPAFFGEIVTKTFVRSVQPTMVGMSLLQQMNFPVGTTTIANMHLHASGTAGRKAMNSGELPTLSFRAGGEVFADLDAVGIMTKLDNKFMTSDMGFSLFQFLADEAVKCIWRYRELEIFNLITSSGTILFSNTSASYSNTSGRNSAGTPNGTLGHGDIFSMCNSLIDAGYTPDVIMFHPLAWLMFAQDPFMQTWGFWNGQLNLFKKPNGDPGRASQFSGTGNTNLGTPFTPTNTKTTYTDVPEYSPYTLKVVVSPYLPLNTTNSTTTVIVGDSTQLGVYAETEGLRSVGWSDMQYDTLTTRWTIHYGLMKSNTGLGIRRAEGVKYNETGYSFGPWNTFRSLTSTLTDPGTSVLF